jgi:uncharacterized protein
LREDAAVVSSAKSPWLNPKLAVVPSRISGLGLFAVAQIERGDVCSLLTGTLMTDTEFAHYIGGRESYSALAIDEGRSLVQRDDDPTTKGNHSCDPNLWLSDAVTVVARRTIEPGEEATIDYALLTVDPSWQMACNCQTDICRRVVTGDDWQLPELQARYAGHWSPFIERRIRLGRSDST